MRPPVEGQERARAILARFLERRRVPPALLFTGLDGTGKTRTAVDFGAALLCGERQGGWGCGTCPSCAAAAKGVHPDLKLVNASYQAGILDTDPARHRSIRIDTVRHLRRDMGLQPMMGAWKIAVIPEAATLEVAAANALLKIIEEPPPCTLWILTTSRPEQVLPTVLSRCVRVRFAPLEPRLLERILGDAGIEASQASQLAALGEGSASRALALARAGWPFPAAPEGDGTEGLPREAALARARVETVLYCLEVELRRRALGPAAPDPRLLESLRELASLRRALQDNADPTAVLMLARRAARLP